MLELKLVLSNIKRQYKIYLIYFVSLTVIIGLLFTYLCLINSIGKLDSYLMLKLLMVGVTIIIAMVLIFIIVYVNKLISKSKAKEYGLYKLYGMSNRKFFKIIFFEQLIAMIITCISGIILGAFLYWVMIVIINFSLTEYNYQLAMSIDLIAVITIFFIALIISLVASFINYKSVIKKDINELLIESNKQSPAKEMSKGEFLIYLVNAIVLAVFIYKIGVMQYDLIELDELFVLSIAYITEIYVVYIVCAYIIVKLMPKSIYYKNENSFTFSLITKRLMQNIKAMTFISIFFVGAVLLIFIGILDKQQVSYYMMKDDIMIKSYNEEIIEVDQQYYIYEDVDTINIPTKGYIGTMTEESFNEIRKQMGYSPVEISQGTITIIEDENISSTQIEEYQREISSMYPNVTLNQEIKLNMRSRYDEIIVVADEDNEFNINAYKIIETNLEKYKDNYKMNKINTYDFVNMSLTEGHWSGIVKESEVNEYLKGINSSVNFKLNKDEFGLIGNMYQKDLDLNINSSITRDENQYPIVQKEQYATPELFIVISDENFEQCIKEVNGVIGYTSIQYEGLEKEQDNSWIEAKQKLIDSNYYNVWISIKTEEIVQNFLIKISFLSFTIYLGLIMFIVVLTMIGVQVNVDSVESKKEFEKMKRINYSRKHLNRSINRITFIYFIVPIIIGILNLIFILSVFYSWLKENAEIVNAMKYDIISYKDFNIVIILMLVIYIIFFVITNYAYKANVEIEK